MTYELTPNAIMLGLNGATRDHRDQVSVSLVGARGLAPTLTN